MISLGDSVVNIHEPIIGGPVQHWRVVLIWTSSRYGERRLAWLVPSDVKSGSRFFTAAFINDLVIA